MSGFVDSPELGGMIAAAIAQQNMTRAGTDGAPFVLVPEGFSVESLERLLRAPERPRGIVTVRDAESFLAYYGTHEAGKTLLLADVDQATATAIFDYHRKGSPGFAQHAVVFRAQATPSWLAWSGMDGKQCEQERFARFLEENLVDVTGDDKAKGPSGATLYAVATELQAKTSSNFLSSKRLSDGSFELLSEEKIEASTKRGQTKIPESFTLALAPFRGSEAVEVTARLRFRIQGGKLVLWFDLHRAQEVLERAFDSILAKIEQGIGSRMLRGLVTGTEVR